MWLALDTATDRASVAVGYGAAALAREVVAGARRQASGILPAIEAILARVGAGYAEIEGVVLADGPGSFTGLRVGAAVAKALVRARGMPLWVTPSLLGCAAAAARDDGVPILAVSDALRGELYAGAWRFGPGGVETLMAPTVLTPEAIRLEAPEGARVVGPAAAMLGGEPTWPEAAQLLGLVGRPGGVRVIIEPAGWEPIYGRPAEAQAKWEREHGRPLDHPARAGR